MLVGLLCSYNRCLLIALGVEQELIDEMGAMDAHEHEASLPSSRPPVLSLSLSPSLSPSLLPLSLSPSRPLYFPLPASPSPLGPLSLGQAFLESLSLDDRARVEEALRASYASSLD